MCFSAEASFTVSAVLLVAGVASIKKVTDPHQLAFASIPLLFSIQQCIEGVLWLSLTGVGNAQLQIPGTYLFLLFAMVVWPVWIPFAFFWIETDKKRKEILSIILGLGIALAVYMLFCLFSYPVNSIVVGHHLHYDLLFPYYLRWFSTVLYFFPTVLSPLISSIKKTWMLGVLVFAANIVSRIFFQDYVLSVWCFFAAIISVIVWSILWAMNEKFKKVKTTPAILTDRSTL